MGRTRTPVGTPGWLWVILAVAAMGFSLMHTLVDFGIILGSLSSSFGVKQSLLSVLIGLLYSWWAWVFAKAVGGANSWLVGLMVFDVLWVGGNGLTIIECRPLVARCQSMPTLYTWAISSLLRWRLTSLTEPSDEFQVQPAGW
jgi:hypothetical protein